jgi:hypothetical protein
MRGALPRLSDSVVAPNGLSKLTEALYDIVVHPFSCAHDLGDVLELAGNPVVEIRVGVSLSPTLRHTQTPQGSWR